MPVFSALNSSISDTELLTRLRGGDAQAVQMWYQKYYTKLFHWISTKIGNANDAEELTQDTFLSCLKHLPLFRGESGIWTWVARIAQHEVADYYRKRYAKKFMHLFPLSDLLEKEELHDAHEISQKVKHVLSDMTHENREVLLMKYVDRKKVRQIAAELGKTVKSVESILFRARLEFRELYSGRNASL
jgi:RNA polymerase sigma-70 factor (ECF subfamily)